MSRNKQKRRIDFNPNLHSTFARMKKLGIPIFLSGIFLGGIIINFIAGIGGYAGILTLFYPLNVLIICICGIAILMKSICLRKNTVIEGTVFIVGLSVFYLIPSTQIFLAGLSLKLHLGNRIPILTKAADSCFKYNLPLSEAKPSFAAVENLADHSRFEVEYTPPDNLYIRLRWPTSWTLVELLIAKNSSADPSQDYGGAIQKVADRMWIIYR